MYAIRSYYGIDCAIRIGDMPDSSLVSQRLGEMRRQVVASPTYLVRFGRPACLEDLARHNCLSLGQKRGWVFKDPNNLSQTLTLKFSGNLECIV